MNRKLRFWTQEQLKDAVAAMSGGSSVREAAKNFNMTLRNHIKSGSAEKVTGKLPILSLEQCFSTVLIPCPLLINIKISRPL
jgi:hypothetical protein